eukprot:GHVU01095942.1.p2 GENE.GHVU01095942.1~~GHVU01095942.1.p2  ORF type:complete len:115 (-),score=11.28 GHVU01095942.1:522-866(-)
MLTAGWRRSRSPDRWMAEGGLFILLHSWGGGGGGGGGGLYIYMCMYVYVRTYVLRPLWGPLSVGVPRPSSNDNQCRERRLNGSSCQVSESGVRRGIDSRSIVAATVAARDDYIP